MRGGLQDRDSVDLSILLLIKDQRERAGRCLTSLLEQEGIDSAEILLMDYRAGAYPPLGGSDHPSVRQLNRYEPEPFGVARSRGVSECRAPVVAFIEDHCQAHPGWLRGLLEEHEGLWAGIGGEVHNGNPGEGVSDVVELLNYYRWMPPARRGEADLLPGHNSSYKTAVLRDYGERLQLLLRCELVLHRQLRSDGYRLLLSPKVKFSHTNEAQLSWLMRGYYLWNRMYSATMVELGQWSILKRSLWVILLPLQPAVRILKLGWYLLTARPGLLFPYLRTLPQQFIAHCSAAAGQWVGLIWGIGAAESDFLKYEVDHPRSNQDR